MAKSEAETIAELQGENARLERRATASEREQNRTWIREEALGLALKYFELRKGAASGYVPDADMVLSVARKFERYLTPSTDEDAVVCETQSPT